MKKARTHQGHLQVNERVRDALMKSGPKGKQRATSDLKKKKCFEDKMERI